MESSNCDEADRIGDKWVDGIDWMSGFRLRAVGAFEMNAFGMMSIAIVMNAKDKVSIGAPSE